MKALLKSYKKIPSTKRWIIPAISLILLMSCETDKSVIGSDAQTPREPFPANGATNQNISLTLGWERGAAEKFDVYFDEVSPPKILYASDIQTGTLIVKNLGFNKTYYWQVVAKSGVMGIRYPGEIWSFKTKEIPFPQLVSPPEGASDQPLTLDLKWKCEEYAQEYDFYLSSQLPLTHPARIIVSYNPENIYLMTVMLRHNTTYYWQVVAIYENGEAAAGGIWSFKTENTISALKLSMPPANIKIRYAELYVTPTYSQTTIDTLDIVVDYSIDPNTVPYYQKQYWINEDTIHFNVVKNSKESAKGWMKIDSLANRLEFQYAYKYYSSENQPGYNNTTSVNLSFRLTNVPFFWEGQEGILVEIPAGALLNYLSSFSYSKSLYTQTPFESWHIDHSLLQVNGFSNGLFKIGVNEYP